MRSFRVELRRASHRRAYRLTILVACAISLAAAVKVGLDGPRIDLPGACADLTSVIGFGAAFAAAFLGASLVGAESGCGALATSLLWEPRRSVVLAAEVVAGAVAGIALAVVVGTVSGSALLIAGQLGGAHGTPTVGLLGQAGRCFAAASVGGCLGAALASAAGSTAAVGFGMFGLFMFVEPLLAGWLRWAAPWMPMAALDRFASGQDGFVTTNLTTVGAALHIALWAALAVAVAWLRFRTQEIR